jgi:hypothetical protein
MSYEEALEHLQQMPVHDLLAMQQNNQYWRLMLANTYSPLEYLKAIACEYCRSEPKLRQDYLWKAWISPNEDVSSWDADHLKIAYKAAGLPRILKPLTQEEWVDTIAWCYGLRLAEVQPIHHLWGIHAYKETKSEWFTMVTNRRKDPIVTYEQYCSIKDAVIKNGSPGFINAFNWAFSQEQTLVLTTPEEDWYAFPPLQSVENVTLAKIATCMYQSVFMPDGVGLTTLDLVTGERHQLNVVRESFHV